MPFIALDELTKIVTSALRASGASESMARATATYLVAAHAQGLATHGVARIPTYCAHLKSGRAKGDAVARVIRNSGAAREGVEVSEIPMTQLGQLAAGR